MPHLVLFGFLSSLGIGITALGDSGEKKSKVVWVASRSMN
jgi:hypothetical protein